MSKKRYAYIVRKETFATAHRLCVNEWSDEKNLEVYSKCTNNHGHNYKLYVTIKSEVDPVSGMVMNFSEVKRIIRENVVNKLDHKLMNDDVEEFKNMCPTTENVAYVIWEWLKPDIPDLVEVKIEETENNTVIYRG